MSIADLAHDEVCLLRLQADRLRVEVERLRAALCRIDEFVNDQHRPLGDKRFEQLADITREALK